MTRLNQIPTRIVNAEQENSANIIALLHEIAELQAHYIQSGEPGGIDLKSLPLTQAEHEALSRLLAKGEIEARLEALGRSEIRETQFPGVWWITHYDAEDDLIADTIEIARVPLILQAADDAIYQGAKALAEMLQIIAKDHDVTREQQDETRPNLG